MNRMMATGLGVLRVFTATTRFRRVSHASKTSPMPPRPRLGPSRYRPSLRPSMAQGGREEEAVSGPTPPTGVLRSDFGRLGVGSPVMESV